MNEERETKVKRKKKNLVLIYF